MADGHGDLGKGTISSRIVVAVNEGVLTTVVAAADVNAPSAEDHCVGVGAEASGGMLARPPECDAPFTFEAVGRLLAIVLPYNQMKGARALSQEGSVLTLA